MGWLGKRMSKGKIFKSMDRLYDSSWRWGGGWMMGDGKEAAKSSWQDSKAFLSRFSSRFKLSSGPTLLTRRHHTNQKTWGVSSNHQKDDRGKEESGPFESEVEISETLEIARRQRGKYLPGRGSQKCRRSVGGKTSLRQDIRTMKKKWRIMIVGPPIIQSNNVIKFLM